MSFFFHLSSWAVYFVQALDGEVLSFHISTNNPITPKGCRTSIKNRQAHASPHLDYSHFIMRRARKHEAGIPVNTAWKRAVERHRVKYQPTSVVTDPTGTVECGGKVYYDNGLDLIPINDSYLCRGWNMVVYLCKTISWNPIICGLFYLTIWWRKLWLNLKIYVCESSHACFS